MTTSRVLSVLIASVFLAVGGWSQAQVPTQPPVVPPAPTPLANPAASSSSVYPQELVWAIAEFVGEGSWTTQLPLLLIRGWDTLPDHHLTDAEKTELKKKATEAALRNVDQQATSLKMALEKKRLLGPLPGSEPWATEKALGDLAAKAEQINGGMLPAEAVPSTVPTAGAWGKGQEGHPWSAASGHDLIVKANAGYAVTGRVRLVGGYLDVTVELYSGWEDRVLSDWTGHFSPEEAGDRMAEVSDLFHEYLLGRIWAGLSVSSVVSGTKVKVQDTWHVLPWWTDDLEPGSLDLLIQKPGRQQESMAVTLVEGQRMVLAIPEGPVTREKLVLETDPPGALLYLDSQYLGPSPQTVDRPFSIARVRAQAAGLATLAWEVGPNTPTPSRRALSPPKPLPSIPAAKDKFYASLALFSFSLTTSAFIGAWTNEQVLLTNAYAQAGDATGFDTAYARYQWVHTGYVSSIVLTSGLFVWMMFQLADYLGAAQANLP